MTRALGERLTLDEVNQLERIAQEVHNNPSSGYTFTAEYVLSLLWEIKLLMLGDPTA